MEFLRRCPSCGKRFSIRAERKELIDRETDSIRVMHDVVTMRTQRGGGIIPVGAVAEEVPVERDTIRISYQCNHCHHSWSEDIPVITKAGASSKSEFTGA